MAFTNKHLRYGIDELPPGLSRITNGVVFANIYILIYNSIFNSKQSKYVVVFSFIMSYWFVLSSYTRQGFILMSLLLIGFGASIYSTFKHKALGLFLVSLTLGIIFYQIIQAEVFIENFINRTQSQIDNDEGSTAYRAYLYRKGMEFIEDNFFIGIGPNNFLKIVGKDAHSGYMSIVSETGIFSIISILILFSFSFLNIIRDYKLGIKSMFFWMIMTVLLAPFFKTIYHLPMFWTGIVIVFFYRTYIIKYNK